MKKDIAWIDFARVLGIFLVVFGHTLQSFPQWNNMEIIGNLWNYIYLFHMPLFFIISGYLYERPVTFLKDIRPGVCWRNVNKLVYSYLIYQLLYLPLVLLDHYRGIGDVYLWSKLCVGIIMGDGYETPYSCPVCLPCWFIVCIIQLRLLFLVVPINKVSCILFSLGSVVFLVFRNILSFDCYFCLDSTIMAIPYFLFGFYIKKIWEIKITVTSPWLKLMVCFICALVVGLILHYNGKAQMNGPEFGKNVFANYAAGFFGSMMIFILAQLLATFIKVSNSLKLISRNTLFLIFSHWVLLWFFLHFKLFKVLSLYSNVIWILLSASVISIVILYFSKLFINKKIAKYPLLFGK